MHDPAGHRREAIGDDHGTLDQQCLQRCRARRDQHDVGGGDASCARPSTSATATPARATARSKGVRTAALAIGATKRSAGRSCASQRRGCAKSPPRRFTSLARLPGSSATICASTGRPSAARADRAASAPGCDQPAGVPHSAPPRPAPHRTPARRAAGTTPGPTARAMCFTRPGRQAQNCGLTYCAVAMPAAAQALLQPQIEIRRVDADEEVNALLEQVFLQNAGAAAAARADGPAPRPVPSPTGSRRRPAHAAGRPHGRTRNAIEHRVRAQSPHGFDQLGAELIAGSLASDDTDAQDGARPPLSG